MKPNTIGAAASLIAIFQLVAPVGVQAAPLINGAALMSSEMQLDASIPLLEATDGLAVSGAAPLVVKVGAKRKRRAGVRKRSRRARGFGNGRSRQTHTGMPTAAFLALLARQRQCMDKLFPSGPCPLTPQ